MAREKRVLPAELMLSYSIETAARISDNSPAHIRNLISQGFLSEKREELIDVGTAAQHNWKLTRTGLARLTGTRLPEVDLYGIAQEIIKSLQKV